MYSMPGRARYTLGLIGWFALLGGLGAALLLSGRIVPALPVTRPGLLGPWLSAHDPLVAAFAVIRTGALAGLAWLVATTATWCASAAAGTLARGSGHGAAGGRRLLVPASVASLLAVVTGAAPPVWADAPVIRRIPDAPPAAAPPPSTPRPAAVPPGRPHTTWTVRSGDSLWSIAVAVTIGTGAAGGPGGPGGGHGPAGGPVRIRVAGYWVRLVAANRRRLVRPADPDLIYPGRIVELPSGDG